MNYDEFAFFNQQLASMLRAGIPLEGALKQLSIGMRSAPLRQEIQALETDLAGGTPLKEALARRSLPDFYRRMVEMGAHTNDLPGVLTLLADHYQRANALWSRLKGLMVYPLLVILVSLGLTLLLSLTCGRFLSLSMQPFGTQPALLMVGLWMPPVLLGVLALAVILALTVPHTRAWLRWRMPAFREASLAELASGLALMLRNGTTLAEALALAETLESGTPADRVLSQWRSLVETGQGTPSQWPTASAPIPPLFLWLVQKGGEDVAAGFEKAAEVYQARANYRIELLLYGALPVSILLLGQMVLWQAVPMFRSLVWMMNQFGQ